MIVILRISFGRFRGFLCVDFSISEVKTTNKVIQNCSTVISVVLFLLKWSSGIPRMFQQRSKVTTKTIISMAFICRYIWIRFGWFWIIIRNEIQWNILFVCGKQALKEEKEERKSTWKTRIYKHCASHLSANAVCLVNKNTQISTCLQWCEPKILFVWTSNWNESG